MSQNGGSCCAISSSIVGFGCSLTYESNTGVFDVILKLDLFSDRDSIIDDLGSTKFFLEYHIAAFWTEGYCDSFGKNVDAFFESTASVLVINNALSHKRRLKSFKRKIQ
mmetsp:Transcript_25553/g.60334  ORF Transcript_25553/g.60334 Transcript_25553/m.60334 type:complete len:109 (+) Transcript_25553:1372-1698(+)